MINLNKESGFITLTVVLIIVLLITALSLMTGNMLMGEQRSASNQVRYHEAMNAAQVGLDKGIAQLMSNFDNRADLTHLTAVPYYQVSFGNISEIALGDNIIRSVAIRSVGTAGYSASSATSTDAESRVAVNQQVIEIPTLSSLPDSPLTVAAGTAIGGNLAIMANPNGGGAGVPLSIWSRELVDIGASHLAVQKNMILQRIVVVLQQHIVLIKMVSKQILLKMIRFIFLRIVKPYWPIFLQEARLLKR